MSRRIDEPTEVSATRQPWVLHLVGGLAAQGGVMAFAETVAGSVIDGFRQVLWKHREFRGERPGVEWVTEGVARATDLGMGHDAMAGVREAVALWRWLRSRAGGPVILHAHSRVGAMAAGLVGRWGRVPPLIHLHKLSGQPWVYRGLVGWSRGRWVFNSQRTREHHGVREGAATVVYPPVRWVEGPSPASGEGQARFVAAGAFVRVKRFDRLIRAVARLRREGVGVPLEIFGRSDPPVDPECDRELAALAAEVPGVRLRGYTGGWAEELRSEDVFVHGAELEAYGIVVLEAFARGCRVVVPRRSVLEELPGVWRGAGGVQETGADTEEGLAAGMRAALAEPADAATRWAVRREVAGRVSLEECVCQLGRLYRSLPGTNGCFRSSSRH